MKRLARPHHRGAGGTAVFLLLSLLLPVAATGHAGAGTITPLYTASPSTTPLFVNMSAVAGVSANASILPPATAEKERTSGFMNGGRGACAIDYDGDGDDDIYVTGPGKNQLFRNNGNWSFEDVTDSAGVGDMGYGMGCASGYLNNDG